jgi:hypothetical protein
VSYSHPATFLPGGVQTGNPGASHVDVIPPASKPILNSASDQHTSGLISGLSKNGANVQRIYVRRAKITAPGTPAGSRRLGASGRPGHRRGQTQPVNDSLSRYVAGVVMWGQWGFGARQVA